MQIPSPGGGNDANIFGSSELKNGLSAWPEFVRHRNHPLLLKDAKDVVEILEIEIPKRTVKKKIITFPANISIFPHSLDSFNISLKLGYNHKMKPNFMIL